MDFLSQDTQLKHREFLNQRRLQYSVLEKSYRSLAGCSLREIEGKRLPRDAKREAFSLKAEILLHELYFDSFSDKFTPSEAVKRFFGSEASFLYEIESSLRETRAVGFLLVYSDGGKLKFSHIYDDFDILADAKPLLAVDLWEHAYFSDYGFDRARYIKNALLHLDFNKINDFYKIG